MNKRIKHTACIFCLFITQMGWAQDTIHKENIAIMDSTFSSGTLVCRLQGPELTKRLALLKEEIFNEVKSVKEFDRGYSFEFVVSEEFVIKLMDYVLSERKCCPFFQFDVSFPPGKEHFSLTISGSPDAKEMIKLFLEDTR